MNKQSNATETFFTFTSVLHAPKAPVSQSSETIRFASVMPKASGK